eukprot:gene17155-21868_t
MVNSPGAVGASGRLTNYALYDSIFTALEPDPVKRDLLVRTYLQNNGLNPDALGNSGFLSGAATMTRMQTGAASLLGVRSTATVTLSQGKTRRLDPFSSVVDDLSGGGLLLQRSGAFTFSHRLSPATAVSLTVSEQRSSNVTTSQATDLKSLLASWNGRINPYLSYSANLRHARFNSAQ